jgi:NSS family neurotransmitter:Na+ symporter
MFFTLVAFAAWTSAISLMEPAVTLFIEQLGFGRKTAAILVGTIIWALGWLTVLSFGPWSELTYFKGTVFDNIEFLTNNIMLPLGGLAIVIFAGWFMAKNSTADELDGNAGTMYRLWRLSARYLAPIAILIVLLYGTGVLDRLAGILFD